MQTTIGFAVIYRWRLHPGKVDQFREQWKRGTQLIMRDEGGLGSRLHQVEDGTWLAYAQWPDKATWEKAATMNPADSKGRQLLLDAIAKSYPPVFLTPVADYLFQGGIRNS